MGGYNPISIYSLLSSRKGLLFYNLILNLFYYYVYNRYIDTYLLLLYYSFFNLTYCVSIDSHIKLNSKHIYLSILCNILIWYRHIIK